MESKSTSKAITVDKDKLTKMIVENCPYYFYNSYKGETCNRKVRKEICDLHAFGDQLNCPQDCPRLTAKDYRCNRGACPRTKAIIKEMKAT